MGKDENKKLQEIRICQAAWSMENALLQAYRGLFLAIEAILFAAGFAVLEMYGKVCWFWPIFGAGVVGAFLWIVVCGRRGDIADMWNREIRERSKDLLLLTSEKTKKNHSGSAYEYEPSMPWIDRGTRYCFNLIIPVILILAWVGMIFLWATANS